MECQEFIVLYTHQKMKKSKVWHDGVLKVTHLGNKATLYDDKGACLESLFLKCLEVKPGDDLESDRYLITIEEVKVAGSRTVKQHVIQEALEPHSRHFISPGWSRGCQLAGLKRRAAGLQEPYKIPKKMAITENGESDASLHHEKPVLALPATVYSSPPLFSTVGKKDTNYMPGDSENIVTCKNRERNGMPSPSVVSTLSFKINSEMLSEENYFCSSDSSGTQHSDSLLTTGPMKRKDLASHYPGVSQNIRSKAQILALLKSTSANMHKDLNSEVTENFSQIPPQRCLKLPTKPPCFTQQEECADTKNTERLHCEPQSENSIKKESRWAKFLPSQSSPEHSTINGNDRESKPDAQDGTDLNLTNLLVDKKMPIFDKCAEREKKYGEDDNGQFWNQEERLAIPSFCENSSSLVRCSRTENVDIVSEFDNQKDKLSVNQNGTMFIEGPVCVGENVQVVNTCSTLEQEFETVSPLLEETSLTNTSRLPAGIADLFPKSNTSSRSLKNEPLEPFLEVTFNLSGFEASDTDEESQEGNRISQDLGSLEKEILIKDDKSCVLKSCENISHQETGNKHLSLLTSIEVKPRETLLSEFCDRTCVGFDAEPCKDRNIEKAIQEQRVDAVSSFDSSLEWNDDVHVDNIGNTNESIQKDKINYDFTSPSNESKNISINLHIPHFLNTITKQTAKYNDLLSEDPHPQPFILGSHLDKNYRQVLPPISSNDIGIQLLNTTQDHSECVEPDKTNIHASSSLFYPLGNKHPISKDTEAYIPETEDLGQVRSLPHALIELETTKKNKQSWNNPRNSLELSEVLNDISFLKSLSEHNTALESLEVVKKKDAAFQQVAQETYEPDSSPEARKPFTTVVSPAVPKSPHLNQDSQQLFSLGSEETAFLAAIPKQLSYGPKPVEFQGHQVKGSATSGVMVRGCSSQLDCNLCPKSIEYENFMAKPELPNTSMHTGCLQISTSSPVSAFSLDTKDEDSVLEFSEESLHARTFPGLKKFSSLENKNLQKLPFVSRSLVPFLTLPPDDGTADFDSCPFMSDCDTHVSSGCSVFTLGEESVVGPEDQSETPSFEECREVTPGDIPLLAGESSQSKWLKYQNAPLGSLTLLNSVEKKVTDGLFAQAVSGICFSDTSEKQSNAMNENSLDSVHLQMIKGMLYEQQHNFSSQNLASRKKETFLNLKQTSKMKKIENVYNYSVKDLQEINGSELCFPKREKVKSSYLPQRHIHIPAVFQSPTHYKQIFTSSIIEHLNILLFELAQRLYKALSKVDISFYMSSKEDRVKNGENSLPCCHHNHPAKLVMVKKEGPNKGRLFYTCERPKADQCKFFKWFEEVTPGGLTQEESRPSMVLSDIKSIGLYLRSQKIPVYEECQLLVRTGFDFQRKQCGKLKKFATIDAEFYSETKNKIYLKLSRKESSSAYNKGDLWVISKTLDFELDTFIACSAFFGPSSINEVELLPLKGYFPSNWPTNMVHALLVCNASTELTTLKNIQDYFNPATLPLMPYLLTMSSSTPVSNKSINTRKFNPPAFVNIKTKFELLSLEVTLQLSNKLIQTHKLNKDQATALTHIAQMMASHESVEGATEQSTHSLPITVIHGVFGAGKSYLLAVVILFLVQLFEKSEALTGGNARPWKLLISSSTNVAVDRVLLGLLSLGFEKFVRVGSVRKIAKPILPYSLHAGSENENEQLKELQALMKEDLTPVEKVYVRKSIEQHKLGTNRTLLKQVRVVGITCAACPFPCMNDLKFPVVVLDECSQMTEPASLLPIARFECEKLILVGDPKQLSPTIQGSDAAHENGLEQTLFDRLCLMGHKPILLRTQYRCHPAISAIANDMFYEGNLMNGISETERSPLLEWLPTLCFYNVKGVEQIERDNSFHNVAEAAFTLKLIQSLIASGIAGSMIGVITLYKSQMYKLWHALGAEAVNYPDIKAVQVSTVDAFQGAEKEIIILSCVRTRQVGFIDSEKRMNVALTRGRRHLLIVGNLVCLRKNRLWGRVIQHCEGREDGLQHASQYESQLNHFLKDYFEKQAEEKQKKRSENEKSKDKSH
uniref:protein ZGRF1 isoform X2 n=1 Tax=Jaculus jaculus TaxID=51337 RepID=UPI001E1AFCB5|nr:protein ZGRF1 isoform X2 [Jaculus jaculus]